MNTPDAIDLAIARDRYAIDVQLLHLTQERIADDLIRAMKLLGCSDVVVNKPALRAVTPLPTGGAVSLSEKNDETLNTKTTAPVHAETDRGGAWQPSSEWREACRDDIERRINL